MSATKAPIIKLYQNESGTVDYTSSYSGLVYDTTDRTRNYVTLYAYNNKSAISGVADLDNPKLYVQNHTSGWIRAKVGTCSDNINDYQVLPTDGNQGMPLVNAANEPRLSGSETGATQYAVFTIIADPSSAPALNTSYPFELWVSGTYKVLA